MIADGGTGVQEEIVGAVGVLVRETGDPLDAVLAEEDVLRGVAGQLFADVGLPYAVDGFLLEQVFLILADGREILLADHCAAGDDRLAVAVAAVDHGIFLRAGVLLRQGYRVGEIGARLERHHDAPVRYRALQLADQLRGAGECGDGVIEVARRAVVAVGGDVHVSVVDERVFFLRIVTLYHRAVIPDGVRVVESHEDGGELLTRGVAAGIQQVGIARLHAGDESHPGRPAEGILRVAVGFFPVGELFYISHSHGVVVLVSREAVHHRRQLLSRYLSARVEFSLGNAVDDVVILRPDDGARIVLSVLHVGEVASELRLGGALHAVEDRHDHPPGHRSRGIELSSAHAVHIAVVVSVFDRPVAPAFFLHVGEGGFFSCHGDRQRPGDHYGSQNECKNLFHFKNSSWGMSST